MRVARWRSWDLPDTTFVASPPCAVRGPSPGAIAALKRSVRELEALNASWTPLAGLTPAQFNSYRAALGEGSGFQSAMYRRLEFLLGEKSASMLVPHRGAHRAHAELEKALHEPSLYDEVLRLLARRGHAIPAEVLDRARAGNPAPGRHRHLHVQPRRRLRPRHTPAQRGRAAPQCAWPTSARR